MKTLSVSDVRDHLPEVINEVAQSNEAIVVSRYGKPIVSIVPFTASQAIETRYPLRGQKIAVAADFDDPTPDLWQALSVAEEPGEYVTSKSYPATKTTTPKRAAKGKPRKRTKK